MDDNLRSKLGEQAKNLARHSWEYGVIFDALLAIHNPELTVFSLSIPPPTFDPSAIPALVYAKQHIRTDHDTLVAGESSAGDPASLGIAALMLGISNPIYYDAAKRQLHALLTQTPRWKGVAISHLVTSTELWSDSIFMFPPFLAYHAVMHSEPGLLLEACRQCFAYQELLRTESGLWMHIVSEDSKNDDPGLWSTGNGWAVMGMVRVLAIIKGCNAGLGDEALIKNWAQAIESNVLEILKAAMKAERDEHGLLRNYINDNSWFGECAGTAAIASAVLRMAVLSPDKIGTEMIDCALSCREAVLRCISEDGMVSPVVNPYSERSREPAKGSAEGQAFVMLLEAAYRDFKNARDRLSYSISPE